MTVARTPDRRLGDRGGVALETYLERYLSGERRGVWAELVGLGPAVRDEPVFSDARAVAHEMMRRVRHNVALLIERLRALGYRFAYPDHVWDQPNPTHLAALDALERRHGPFPLVVRAWYEEVGAVNLVGAHPKLASHWDLDWNAAERLGRAGDPLAIGRLFRSESREALIPLAGMRAEDFEDLAEDAPPFCLEIGGDATGKAGESGSGSYFILVPNPCFDAPIVHSGDWEGTFFVPYLRTIFEWGGFPGLRPGLYPGDTWDPAASRAEIAYLTSDLLPL